MSFLCCREVATGDYVAVKISVSKRKGSSSNDVTLVYMAMVSNWLAAVFLPKTDMSNFDRFHYLYYAV